MAFFDWDQEKYTVGIAEIDEQHKKLVKLLNQLFDAMQAGKGNDVLSRILNDLVAYTKTHFAHEERMMQAANYPDFGPHKAEHEKLAQKAADLLAQFKSGKVTISLEVGRFLKDWLNNHILGIDKKYGPCLAGK